MSSGSILLWKQCFCTKRLSSKHINWFKISGVQNKIKREPSRCIILSQFQFFSLNIFHRSHLVIWYKDGRNPWTHILSSTILITTIWWSVTHAYFTSKFFNFLIPIHWSARCVRDIFSQEKVPDKRLPLKLQILC